MALQPTAYGLSRSTAQFTCADVQVGSMEGLSDIVKNGVIQESWLNLSKLVDPKEWQYFYIHAPERLDGEPFIEPLHADQTLIPLHTRTSWGDNLVKMSIKYPDWLEENHFFKMDLQYDVYESPLLKDCAIQELEWVVGTTPLATDWPTGLTIMTDKGLVLTREQKNTIQVGEEDDVLKFYFSMSGLGADKSGSLQIGPALLESFLGRDTEIGNQDLQVSLEGEVSQSVTKVTGDGEQSFELTMAFECLKQSTQPHHFNVVIPTPNSSKPELIINVEKQCPKVPGEHPVKTPLSNVFLDMNNLESEKEELIQNEAFRAELVNLERSNKLEAKESKYKHTNFIRRRSQYENGSPSFLVELFRYFILVGGCVGMFWLFLLHIEESEDDQDHSDEEQPSEALADDGARDQDVLQSVKRFIMRNFTRERQPNDEKKLVPKKQKNQELEPTFGEEEVEIQLSMEATQRRTSYGTI